MKHKVYRKSKEIIKQELIESIKPSKSLLVSFDFNKNGEVIIADIKDCKGIIHVFIVEDSVIKMDGNIIVPHIINSKIGGPSLQYVFIKTVSNELEKIYNASRQ